MTLGVSHDSLNMPVKVFKMVVGAWSAELCRSHCNYVALRLWRQPAGFLANFMAVGRKASR